MPVKVKIPVEHIPDKYKQYAVDEHTMTELADGVQARINTLAAAEAKLGEYKAAIDMINRLPDNAAITVDGVEYNKATLSTYYQSINEHLPTLLANMRAVLPDIIKEGNPNKVLTNIDEELLIDLKNVYEMIRNMQGGQQ